MDGWRSFLCFVIRNPSTFKMSVLLKKQWVWANVYQNPITVFDKRKKNHYSFICDFKGFTMT